MNREFRETIAQGPGMQVRQAAVDPAPERGSRCEDTPGTDPANPHESPWQLLSDRFRCPENGANLVVSGDLSHDSGYFQLGAEAVCYGQCSSARPAKAVSDCLHDVLGDVVTNASSVLLPFDPVQVIDNLRRERYLNVSPAVKSLPSSGALRNIYYAIRPGLRVSVRRHLQKLYFRGWEKIPFPRWPIDTTVETIFERLLALSMKANGITKAPFIWFWPDGARSCAIMTHDVETSAGLNFCSRLMDLNDSFGIKSSFQFIPEERYAVSQSTLEQVRARGFEVNVHDLNHDGRLMNNRSEFLRRVQRINAYGLQFGAHGFRSAVMYRNLDWYDALKFSYDMSVPNVAHLDPQQGGCCTVFPFFVGEVLEIPVTTIQDYSLFQILNDYSIRIWREQVSRIRAKNGLMSFIVHPDYIIDEVPRRVYAELLQYLSELRTQEKVWITLPGDVAAWWRLRSRLNLTAAGGAWRIEGQGSERARLAYAVLKDDALSYELE